MAGENILRDGELGVEAEFLINSGDTKVLGFSRVRQADRLAVDTDLSLVGAIDPGDDLNQSGFTGSVLSE